MKCHQSGTWLAVGIGVGVAIGTATNALAVGISVGVAVGAALDVAFASRQRSSCSREKPGANAETDL